MGFEASCPGCGAPVEFGVANSLVTVCASCGTVVGRAEGRLEDYGKVAELVQTDSPLTVGLEGRYQGVPYEVTGRVQLRHPAGGVWNEWYVAFRGGERWGWLAEAQGRFYLTFRRKLPKRVSLPSVPQLQVDQELNIAGVGRWKVAEVGVATLVSAEGEIPYRFRPGETYAYADLVGRNGKFATLDASEQPPALFVGKELSLAELGIATAATDVAARKATAVAINCPNCGGSLDLKAPDEAERVVCPYCDSLLDVEQGNLKYLETLKQSKVHPVLPLGSAGTLRGRHYTVIGFLQRQVTYEGETWRWQEFLLYTPGQPFHWLIYNVGHWNLGVPVSPADVQVGPYLAHYEGKTFRVFDRSVPVVSAVYGEFYWKVHIGERVKSVDYVKPPLMLSREESLPEEESLTEEPPSNSSSLPPVAKAVIGAERAGRQAAETNAPPTAREVNYTLSTYIPPDEIHEAFKVRLVRRPTTIAPNQPYPYPSLLPSALFMLCIALVAGVLVYLTAPKRNVLERTFTIPAGSKSATFLVEQPFQLKSWGNLLVVCSGPTPPRALYFEGKIYNEATGATKSFGVAVVKRRGNRIVGTKYFSRPRSGAYTLQLDVHGPSSSTPGVGSTTEWYRTPTQVQIAIYQGVPRFRYWLALVVALLAVPVGLWLHRLSFEQRRWAESDFT